MLPVLSSADADRIQLAADLERLAPGQVRFGTHDRMLYATDASIYQVEPLGVVIPRDIETLSRIVEYCGRQQVALLPRGGGTSLPGQCTNRAVVVDHSACCRQVLGVDPLGKLCHVEPGITVDDLNRELERRRKAALATEGGGAEGWDGGLFFAPDPATVAQATIGGCIGNNAAGARSIRYGRTSENVAGLDVILTTGQRTWLEAGAGRHCEIARNLAAQVATVVRRYAEQIRQRYPKTKRRNAGYALDLILQQLDQGIAPEDLDLTGLICGSEGTLAVVLGARLRLHPVPQSKGLAILSFSSLEEAIAAVVPILQTGPSAVELLDDVVLGAARSNAECRTYMDLLADVAGSPPAAVLYVEYQQTGPIAEVTDRFTALRGVVPQAPLRTYLDPPTLLRAWALRKAGEPLLHGLATARKPVTCVEDNAVPVERLVEFVARFKQIVTKHGTTAAYYAHASVGVLHVRPLLDLHDEADLNRLRAIAVEVADLARDCGGVMSGEHGDGRLRSPLLERFYGPQLMQAFREIKAIFDPAGILNPGNIVGAGPLESITQKMRIKPAEIPLHWPGDGIVAPRVSVAPGESPGLEGLKSSNKNSPTPLRPGDNFETYFNYHDQEGFPGALEMCSGAGVCRKNTGSGGVMCPSYRATLDERHSTRGRANALRLAISGQLSTGTPQAAWNDPETEETLSLCLSCKACKTECPSNVDVARLKAEYTAQRYKMTGHIPLQDRVFGHVRRLNRFGSLLPGLANWVTRLPAVRGSFNRVLGLAPERTLPPFAPSLYRWFARHPLPPDSSQRPRVVLFGDCFVTYNEPEIGRQAVAVLEALGYSVALPKVGCCGRAMISHGLLADAIRSADRVLAQLAPYINDPAVKAIVVCEPSCLSAMQDDWLQLKLQTPMDLRRRLAAKALAVEDFIERFWSEHPIRPELKPVPEGAANGVVYHGHCHQKALSGSGVGGGTKGGGGAEALLRRIAGPQLRVLPSGCCGMAGAFGYAAQRYDLSMKIGEQSLFSLLRDVPPESTVVAAGTSCRHQIKDGTGRRAIHPVTLAAQALGVT